MLVSLEIFKRRGIKAITACILTLCITNAQLAQASELEKYFPQQNYPRLNDGAQDSKEIKEESLRSGIQQLGKEIQQKVKTVAKRRNIDCFGDPCLLQGLPLLYNIPDSGFFGGFQANFSNIARTNPYLYSFNLRVVRSDTNQWLSRAQLDIPEIESLLPFTFRAKLRGAFYRGTEFRYSGEGQQGQEIFADPNNQLRYSLEDLRGGLTVLIPINVYRHSKLGLYASYDYSKVKTDNFGSDTSVLYQKQPLAYQGDTYRTAGIGVYFDSRDREILTRQGEMLEWGFAAGHLEDAQDMSYRMTLIDRRYYSEKRWTLAHRLTVDGIFGAPPFWELTAVGGVDPIRDLSASGILKGYPEGRFHENFKLIESAELRLHQNQMRLFGQRGDLALMLAGLDVGLLNEVFVWSFSTGFDAFWNNSFLTRLYFAYAEPGWSLRLRFSQEF